MRPRFFALGLSLALLHPSNLKADDPPLAANAGIAWPPQSVPDAQPLPEAPVVPPRAVGPQWLDTEVLLGLPTEVRIQWAALRGANIAFMLEGIVGVDVVPDVLFGIAGVGGRVRWAVCNGERNAFVIKPGADVYEWFGPLGIRSGRGGADVELMWWHNCGSGNRFGFELGADLGAFFFYDDFNRGWWAWPMVSAIFGLHF